MITRNMDTGLYSIGALTTDEMGVIGASLGVLSESKEDAKLVFEKLETCLQEIEKRIPDDPE